MPAASCRIMPARSISWCETICASDGRLAQRGHEVARQAHGLGVRPRREAKRSALIALRARTLATRGAVQRRARTCARAGRQAHQVEVDRPATAARRRMAETQVVVMNLLLQLRVHRRAGIAAVAGSMPASAWLGHAQRQDGEQHRPPDGQVDRRSAVNGPLISARPSGFPSARRARRPCPSGGRRSPARRGRRCAARRSPSTVAPLARMSSRAARMSSTSKQTWCWPPLGFFSRKAVIGDVVAIGLDQLDLAVGQVDEADPDALLRQRRTSR